MSTRRNLILAGTTTLVLSTLTVGAAGASSPGASPASTSPAGPSAAAPRIDASLQRGLEPTVSGVPRDFEVGGAAKEFSYTIDNPSAHDFVAFPLLKFKNTTGDLRVADLKVEYQLPGRTDWLKGSLAPGSEGANDGVLIVLGGTDGGNVADEALVALRKGKTLALKVRTSFSAQAPAGKAGVAPVLFAAQLDDRTGLPVDRGSFGCACGAGCAGFRIKPPAPVVTATPTRAPVPVVTTTAPAPTVKPTTPAPVVTTTAPVPTVKPTTPAPVVTTTAPVPTAKPTTPAPVVTTTPTLTPTSAGSSPASSPTRPASPAPTTAPTTAHPTPSSPPSTPAESEGVDQPPLPIPIDNPTIAPLKIQPAAVVQAKTTADAREQSLAHTGGGGNDAAIAGAGAAALAVGAGVLVLVRRRRTARHG
ncbi:LPXTG cell wall anchor domain-containing protein [Kitasatospora sp. NPDC003701]